MTAPIKALVSEKFFGESKAVADVVDLVLAGLLVSLDLLFVDEQFHFAHFFHDGFWFNPALKTFFIPFLKCLECGFSRVGFTHFFLRD